jgi:hypothetical protein
MPLTRDYNRIITLSIGGLVTACFGLMEIVLLHNGHLHAYSDKFWYVNLIIGAGLAILLGGWRRRYKLSYAVFCLAALDLSFGLATDQLSKFGLGRSFMPQDITVLRFSHHPLLQVVPTPGYADRNTTHDSNGFRRSLPIDPAKPSIFALGGSTTYDSGVKMGNTWAERLEEKLEGRANVINFGVPGYSTVENLIQSAFYLDKNRFRIHCAIYYVGWNDIRNSFLPNLDPGYADFHLPSQIDNLEVRRRTFLNAFSVGTLMNRLLTLRMDTARAPPDYSKDRPQSGIDDRLLSLYTRNVSRIAFLDRQAGIVPLFIGQVLNESQFTAEARYGWFPLVRDKDVPAIQRHFNAALAEAGRSEGFKVILFEPKRFGVEDFVDNGHFSPVGAMKFADGIGEIVRETCLP